MCIYISSQCPRNQLFDGHDIASRGWHYFPESWCLWRYTEKLPWQQTSMGRVHWTTACAFLWSCPCCRMSGIFCCAPWKMYNHVPSRYGTKGGPLTVFILLDSGLEICVINPLVQQRRETLVLCRGVKHIFLTHRKRVHMPQGSWFILFQESWFRFKMGCLHENHLPYHKVDFFCDFHCLMWEEPGWNSTSMIEMNRGEAFPWLVHITRGLSQVGEAAAGCV